MSRADLSAEQLGALFNTPDGPDSSSRMGFPVSLAASYFSVSLFKPRTPPILSPPLSSCHPRTRDRIAAVTPLPHGINAPMPRPHSGGHTAFQVIVRPPLAPSWLPLRAQCSSYLPPSSPRPSLLLESRFLLTACPFSQSQSKCHLCDRAPHAQSLAGVITSIRPYFLCPSSHPPP